MKKERSITRTIAVFTYAVKVYDDINDSLLTLWLKTIGDEDEKTRLKELKTEIENKGYSLVKVLDVTRTDEARRMSEKQFYYDSIEA